MSKDIRTFLYTKWSAIKGSCINPNNQTYSKIGAKGIKVYDGWAKDFNKFYIWALKKGFTINKSIDRYNYNKDFTPKNCYVGTNPYKKGKEHHKYIHGKSNVKAKHTLYARWNGIKNGCTNSKQITYKSTGAKGIKVCEEWNDDFPAFYNWAITNGFTNERVLHRNNPNGHFAPNNCCWISKKKKGQLVSKNIPKIKVKHAGITYSIKDLATKLEISYSLLYDRLRRNPPNKNKLYKY